MTITAHVVALAALCGGLAIGACAASATAPPPPAPAAPAATVRTTATAAPKPPSTAPAARPDAGADVETLVNVHIGESATAPKSTVTITFTAVGDDSRCPTNVTCVWAGDAAVTLRVQPAKGTAEVVTLHTGLANARTATAAGLRLRLESLEPRPTFGKGIDRSAYVATIAIAKE